MSMLTLMTVSTDEDATTGYMLDDKHAPKTPDERLAMFCLHAAREWDMVIDPRKLHCGDRRGFKPYAEGDDGIYPADNDEPADSYWFVFTDLDEAVR